MISGQNMAGVYVDYIQWHQPQLEEVRHQGQEKKATLEEHEDRDNTQGHGRGTGSGQTDKRDR